MRRQRLMDWGRRALIALLLISALLLLRRTGYYDGFRHLLRLGGAAAGESADTVRSDDARSAVNIQPVAVTVHSAEGGARYGAAYDAEATAGVLRRFSVDLGEALGSADAPAPIDEAAFHDALDGWSVCFHFADPLPLGLLSGWLGTEMLSAAASDSAAMVCLAVAEEETALLYRTPDGAYYRCATAARPEGLRARAAEYPANGALYAWESELLPGGGDFVLLPGAPSPATVRSAVTLPYGAERDELLGAMGMNSFVASSYTEADGTVVYVHDETSLRITPAGTVVQRGPAGEGGAGTLADAVDRAWRLAERSVGALAGDGKLLFAGARYDAAQDAFVVQLDYCVDGIPVRLASGHAAEFTLHGESLLQARLQLRRFTRSEEHTALLPWLQAAAVALAQQGTPALVYADAGEDTACIWVIADG